MEIRQWDSYGKDRILENYGGRKMGESFDKRMDNRVIKKNWKNNRDIDPEMRGLIDDLNVLAKLPTFTCCFGHPGEYVVWFSFVDFMPMDAVTAKRFWNFSKLVLSKSYGMAGGFWPNGIKDDFGYAISFGYNIQPDDTIGVIISNEGNFKGNLPNSKWMYRPEIEIRPLHYLSTKTSYKEKLAAVSMLRECCREFAKGKQSFQGLSK